MDNIFHEYTAGELLEWLQNEEATPYLEQEIEQIDDESIIIETFDIEAIKTNFMNAIHRYIVVERGYKLYLHDNQTCNDIMFFRYTDENKEEIQSHIDAICEDLNQRKISFVGRKYRCD